MRVEAVELHLVDLPLVRPFRTAHGETRHRRALLVRVRTDVGEGWGECVAEIAPRHAPDFVAGEWLILRDHLVPALLAEQELDPLVPADRDPFEHVAGHHTAKAALRTALLDAALRAVDRPLATHLGAVRERVDSGVAVGIADDPGALAAEVAERIDEGYRRVKLKIAPGADVDRVAAVRADFPELLLQVDANGAYRRDDTDHLAGLDPFGLLLLEQPLPEDDLLGHAELARRVTTPVCLDEPIVSARVAETAIALGACRVVNVKVGRCGGLAEAVAVRDVCAARGVPVWCGGALETGIGRAVNVALAALPGFDLPGDLSASSRWFATDVTAPLELGPDGCIGVLTGPGLGIEVRRDVLSAHTAAREVLRA